MKRILKSTKGLLLLTLSVMLLTTTLSNVQAYSKKRVSSILPPSTHAQAASLIDVKSGRLLYHRQGDKILPIASLTKIMTAIVAIEHGKLEERVKVGKNAYAKEGSSLYLQLGEEMTLEHMLYGLMLRSGNDAATAIAEKVGGSEEGFVHLMNQKALMIGLKNTHFANPHGLDAKGHYSTANDLARLTAYALHNPIFREIVRTPSKTAPNPNDPWDYKWANKNKMLRLYEGADGVKTGYTKIAKRCLVSSATKDGQQLVAVTLNDGDDWNDHCKLLDFGFVNYPLQTLIKQDEQVDGKRKLRAIRSFEYPIAEYEQQELDQQIEVFPENPLSFSTKGRLKLTLHGSKIGYVPLYSVLEDQKN